MKEKTVCFTGHRVIPPLHADPIKRKLKDTLTELIENGYYYFCAGGALGFDMLAALSVLELKKTYPQIRLILILPCVSQANRWSKEDQNIYESIKMQADKIIYTSFEYTRGCMHKRNRRLVDSSSVCVCYLTRERGGTAYTVKYSSEHRLRVINIAPELT